MEKVRVDKRSIEKEVKEISVLGIGRKSECSCFENDQNISAESKYQPKTVNNQSNKVKSSSVNSLTKPCSTELETEFEKNKILKSCEENKSFIQKDALQISIPVAKSFILSLKVINQEGKIRKFSVHINQRMKKLVS